MVINGAAEFTGSDARRAAREIDAASLDQSATYLSIRATRAADITETLSLDVRASSPPKNAELLVAITEDNLESDVKRGENSGRQLAHDAVVRWFQHVDMKENEARVTAKLDPA